MLEVDWSSVKCSNKILFHLISSLSVGHVNYIIKKIIVTPFHFIFFNFLNSYTLSKISIIYTTSKFVKSNNSTLIFQSIPNHFLYFKKYNEMSKIFSLNKRLIKVGAKIWKKCSHRESIPSFNFFYIETEQRSMIIWDENRDKNYISKLTPPHCHLICRRKFHP